MKFNQIDSAPNQVVRPVNRLQFIDGLRGIAVGLVIFFHAAIWAGLDRGRLPYTGLALGRAGVDLFLALSGFCLFWPLLKNEDGNIKKLEAGNYLKRRIKRIFPPYYAALALITLCSYLNYRFEGPSWWNQPSFQNIFPWNGTHSAFNLATHLVLLHGLFNTHAHAFDGAFWSLSLEWQFYFLFLPLAWIARKVSLPLALLIPLVVSLLFRVSLRKTHPAFLDSFVGSELSLGRWVEFGAGMLAALSVRASKSYWPDSWRRITSLPYLIFSLGLALFAEFYRSSSVLLPFAWANASFSLLAYSGRDNFLRRALEWRPLVWLGSISYSLYLVHGSTFMIMALFLSRYHFSESTRKAIFLIMGPALATTFAAAFFVWFEKPFMNKASNRSRDENNITVVQDQSLL